MSNQKQLPLVEVLSQLNVLYENGSIRAIDYQFARFLAEQIQDSSGSENDHALVSLLGALTSFQLGAGHTCVDLNLLPMPFCAQLSNDPDRSCGIKLPAGESQTAVLAETLSKSSVIYAVPMNKYGNYFPEHPRPLALEGSRLYLYRYWRYEIELAAMMREMLEAPDSSSLIPLDEPDTIKKSLTKFFPVDADNPWPQIAAALALKQRVLIISGGPGTGKTTTVTRILALLCDQLACAGKRLNIQLAAPTGKAATRLNESIAKAKLTLDVAQEVQDMIPDTAKTLHRLLGVIPGSMHFRFHRRNRLHLDVLLLDEASMIDLPMMHAVISALPEHARLILLGDKDQLASVEPGSVLAELCASGHNRFSPETSQYIASVTAHQPQYDLQISESAITNSICQLRKSYRFDSGSAIGEMARGVNNGDCEVLEKYWQKEESDLSIFPFSRSSQLFERAYQYYRNFILASSRGGAAKAAELLQTFGEFQILCATREGPYGVVEINQFLEDRLHQSGVINKHNWYAGCPIMITANSYRHQLYNGDVGICLPISKPSQQLRIFFPASNSEQGLQVRSFLPSRLPSFEKVFAMTVHKSQGSEFDEVLLAYPPSDSPVLSRELLYTAVTRAKKRCDIIGEKEKLKMSIKRKTRRDSGLGARFE